MQTLQRFIEDAEQMNHIDRAAQAMLQAIKADGKILSCGNGGSHCDAMHFAEELTGRYRGNRPGIAAIAISDVSHISCVGNDYGYDQIFSRYVEAVGRKGDVLLAISSSGNSAVSAGPSGCSRASSKAPSNCPLRATNGNHTRCGGR